MGVYKSPTLCNNTPCDRFLFNRRDDLWMACRVPSQEIRSRCLARCCRRFACYHFCARLALALRGTNLVMKRCAIYARVSTSDQNPEMQLLALRDCSQHRGFSITREYVDQVTGNVQARKRERAQAFEQLMADARRHRFDVVLVWKFDRFARSLSGLIDALDTFQRLGIDFISSTQDVDTTSPHGRLFFHMIAAFAEFERELIVERVNAGLASARRRGVIFGRPRLPGENDVLKLYAEGVPLREIARRTNRSFAGVRKVVLRSQGLLNERKYGSGSV